MVIITVFKIIDDYTKSQYLKHKIMTKLYWFFTKLMVWLSSKGGGALKDYRQVLEGLNLIRGNKCACKWLIEITKLECEADSCEYVEYKPYLTVLKLKKELVNRTGPIPHKYIRDFINKEIVNYDEEYIAKVGQLFNIIESHILDEDAKENTLLEEIKQCLNLWITPYLV